MGLFSQHAIGVDLGRSSVRVVGVELGKKPKVIGCAEVPVDPQFLTRDGFSNHDVIGAAIRQALKEAQPHPIKPGDIYATVSETLVFRKILELPILNNDEELQQIIRAQAAEYLPDSIETVELDFQPLSILGDGKTQQVAVLAVSKRAIQDYQAVFSSAKLSLRSVDAKPSAIGRAMVGPQEKEPLVLVDIGSEASSISVYADHLVWVTGTVNLGGSIVQNAETGEIDKEKEEELAKRLAANLTDELDHVVKFYTNRTAKESQPKEIRVAGSGSMNESILKMLESESGMKVVPGKPVVAMPSHCDRRFFGALGNALYPLYELL